MLPVLMLGGIHHRVHPDEHAAKDILRGL